MKPLIIFAILFLGTISFGKAQVFTNKEVGKRNAALRDSLKNSEYPYSLPIWGKKATKAGFDLPYSAGVSTQYFWQQSDIIIDNLMVGFNDGPMYNLDELVRFDKAIATASAISVRPDIWLFPFLNLYAILGRTQASTDVGFGVWLPDSSNTDKQIFSASSKVNFSATTAGFGMTPTIGVAGGFLALDMNVAWTDVPQLEKPAFSFVFGPRFGKNFKLRKPQQALAIWVGAFRVKISSGTNGSVYLSDVFPEEELGQKIEAGYERVGDAQEQVDAWWTSLSAAEQQNPINQAKYERANSLLVRAGELVFRLDNAVSSATEASVQYSMDKRPKNAWNFITGTQFQLNKHWLVRAEVGFLGTRTQVMAGLQYRFGL